MAAYYNDNDRHAAQWLRNLISAGLIPDGTVDERSIVDIEPGDLRGFSQCHFFAGIGGWPYALFLAQWPEEYEVWTGSCPCQPLSIAGQRQGHADDLHLWPAFYRLIAECKPATVFGEQVASKDGREWLAGVRADLEAAGYACGAADLCAAGVGAPHIRQRLFWVANAEREFRCFGAEDLAGASREDQGATHQREWFWDDPANGGKSSGLGDSIGNGRERSQDGNAPRSVFPSPWDASQLVTCQDGKSRRVPIEPALFPLAYGLSGRVGLLRGSGNAIVPQIAAEFVSAFMECC